jgi:hypothetical protein
MEISQTYAALLNQATKAIATKEPIQLAVNTSHIVGVLYKN